MSLTRVNLILALVNVTCAVVLSLKAEPFPAAVALVLATVAAWVAWRCRHRRPS